MCKPIVLMLVAFSLIAGQGCTGSKCTRGICPSLEFHHELSKWYREQRNCKWANAAWLEIESAAGETFSPDYERGFKHGYADFLTHGGNGNVPPVPPQRYWTLRYESAAGEAAIEEWFAGFAHGAAEAQASGIREIMKIPATTTVRTHRDFHHHQAHPAEFTSERQVEELGMPAGDTP